MVSSHLPDGEAMDFLAKSPSSHSAQGSVNLLVDEDTLSAGRN